MSHILAVRQHKKIDTDSNTVIWLLLWQPRLRLSVCLYIFLIIFYPQMKKQAIKFYWGTADPSDEVVGEGGGVEGGGGGGG
jgi:hypothetical protein